VPTAVERNRPAAQTAGMAKKPEPTKPISWNVYKIVNKAIQLVTIDAPCETTAIEKIEEPAEADRYTAMTRRRNHPW
jgi:hypothetical protein